MVRKWIWGGVADSSTIFWEHLARNVGIKKVAVNPLLYIMCISILHGIGQACWAKCHNLVQAALITLLRAASLRER